MAKSKLSKIKVYLEELEDVRYLFAASPNPDFVNKLNIREQELKKLIRESATSEEIKSLVSEKLIKLLFP